ncbi:CPBP family intramembrane glutamic endopeptidase [Niameybacter massiliensis]|uniref:CPBP family intramembrane glutamic endopeptidase n=1 Tax=Niameybacter massiliensis TaxID=1658108 RepID=UPI0006B59B04|nr:CPBP family intramembrane glutamic endopeptidase [Niameybacter massiliensis]
MLESMLILINQGVNMIFQIILFGIIPFGWYALSHRSCKGFFEYIGIKRTKKQSYTQAFKITAITYIFSIIVLLILKAVQGGMSTNALIKVYDKGIVIYSISLILFGLQTGISEEILFRGFFAKGLIKRYGFLRGNTLQTLIFMCPHIMTFGQASLLECALGMINSGVIGFAFGYIMHDKTEGSIIPIIGCHMAVNIISSIIINVL